jgi:acetyltransferase
MSSNKPKYGVLDYFFGPKASIANSIEEAIANNQNAVLLTSPEPIAAELLRQAEERGIAILGPGSYGIAAPHEGINHCLSLSPILPGRIAFVTQSGSLGASILDWAHLHQIGFSKFIALGAAPSITLGECIDYLAEDPHTQSILLYLEHIEDARHFISAARECALQKPIIVLKPGKGNGKKDSIYDAAFRRCGILRVSRMADLFYMAEVLERQPRPKGPNLAILTNASGPALLAADALSLAGGTLHSLTDLTDLAGPENFREAFDALAKEASCHGILTIVTPQPATRIADTARALANSAKSCKKTLLASMMGGKLMGGAEAILSEVNMPTFPYADTAAKVYQRLWQYSRTLSGLYETPMFVAETEGLAGDTRPTMQQLLRAYGITLSQAPSVHSIGFTITCLPDKTFGPVLHIAAAGYGTTVYEDQVATLPPLTSTLARRALDLVALTRAASPAALQSLEETLVRISRMISELPVLRELEVELQVEPDGTLWASQARVEFQPEDLPRSAWPKCVIRPYPSQYVKPLTLRNGEQAVIRPIKPVDETKIVDFHNDLSERSVYLRYLQFLKFEERISHERLARVCFNDYSRELALVVEKDDKILAVGRLQRNPLRMEEGEVAFLVRDSAQGQGIGRALVENIIIAAKAEGLTKLTAELLADNKPMRTLLERAGFRMRLAMDGQTLLATMTA